MAEGNLSLRWLRYPFGRPLRRTELPHQVLAKKYALPIFASDALSSVAYGPEEILKVLALAGTVYFHDALWIVGAIVVLLAIVFLSYRQTIYAYPNGGGAYIVARDNLGEGVAQVAGCALLIDYILTVAVSLASGVANFASGLHQFLPGVPNINENALARTLAALAVLFLMWYVNKRGVRESGRVFAVPTYFFLASVFILLGMGFVRALLGNLPTVDPATVGNIIHADRSLSIFLILRAFANGSTTLTGVEAISNGITAFQEPKSKNAATTMAYMCGLLGIMALGITQLALATHAQASTSETVISQIGRTVFSSSSPFYVCLIFGTALVLVMAANTSFADFPRLAALHAGDGFLPHWLTDRDNRLVYGIGITTLSLAAGLLILVFKANVDSLIPLYAIGVFLSFTISQSGMVVRWQKVSRLKPGEEVPSYSPEGILVTVLRRDPHWRLKQAINALGAAMTACVTVIFAVTKFTEGAWLVIVLVPSLTFIFFRIHHHYKSVGRQLAVDDREIDAFLATPDRKMRLLAVQTLNRQTLPALRDLLQTVGRNEFRQAVHVDTNEYESAALRRRWEQHRFEEMGLPLVIVPSTFGGGNVVGDLVAYVEGMLAADPSVRVEIVIPEWTTSGGWLHWLATRALHHLTGMRLKLAFLSQERVTVTNHRYLLKSQGEARPQLDEVAPH